MFEVSISEDAVKWCPACGAVWGRWTCGLELPGRHSGSHAPSPAGGDTTVLQSVFVVEPGGAAAWAAVVDMSAAAQVALHPSAVCLE